MTAPWPLVRTGELVKVHHGWPFKSSECRPYGTDEAPDAPLVTAIGHFDYSGGFRSSTNALRRYVGPYPAEYELDPGDILLVMTCQTEGGEILGVPAVVPDDGHVYLHNQRIGRIQVLDPERLDAGFFYQFARSEGFNRQLFVTASGSKILHTSPARIEDTTIALPSMGEQRAIAEVLGALDDKIAANDRLVAVIGLLAQHLVSTADDWVPVSELASPETKQVKPDQFDELVAHFSLPAFDEARRPILDRGDEIKSNKQVLDRPVVLVSKLNPRIPRVWDVPALPEQMALASTEFVVLRPRVVSTSELAAAVGQPAVMARLAGGVSGTSGSHQRIKPAAVFEARVPDPRTLPENARDVVTVGGLLSHRRRNENRLLAELRDTLLPPLMSGRISVKVAEQTVSEVV